MKQVSVKERRAFPRLNIPIYCRPARPDELKRMVVDASLGGVRVYTNEYHNQGENLELEFFNLDGTVLKCTVTVRWITSAPMGSEMQFEAGLEFVEVPSDVLDLIRSFLTSE